MRRLVWILLQAAVATGFCSQRCRSTSSLSTKSFSSSEGWLDLVDDGGVRKKILDKGTDGDDVPQNGAEVHIDYVGTLMANDWSADEVIKCWLTAQQGLEDLADKFSQEKIDGTKLMDESFFTEDFVMSKLGVTNKIKCKKLIMAARRLNKVRDEFPVGMEFDSNKEKGEPYKFVLGAGKTIRGMDLGVASMKVGEQVQIVCRSDYAYGADGVRKRNGDVMVPPFATLCFYVRLLQ